MIKNGTYDIDAMYVGDETVVKAYLGDEEVWSSDIDYLCFEALEDCQLFIMNDNRSGEDKNYLPEVYYSYDKLTWEQVPVKNAEEIFASGVTGDTIDVHLGDVIYLKGNNPYGFSRMDEDDRIFVVNCFTALKDISTVTWIESDIAKFNIRGDMTTLINGRGNLRDLSQLYSWGMLMFISGSMSVMHIVDTTGLKLPSIILGRYAYYALFGDQKFLINSPELPATILTEGCYCQMFSNCTSLNYVKCLATDISATSCTSNWVDGVSSNGTFICPNSMRSAWDAKSNYSGKPYGWVYQDA